MLKEKIRSFSILKTIGREADNILKKNKDVDNKISQVYNHVSDRTKEVLNELSFKELSTLDKVKILCAIKALHYKNEDADSIWSDIKEAYMASNIA